MNVLEQIQRQETKITRGLEHLSYGQAQRPGVVHPGKEKGTLTAAFQYLNISNIERAFLPGSEATEQDSFVKMGKRFILDGRTKFFYNDCWETLKQVTQRRFGCLIPGCIQNYVGQGLKQCNLLKDVPYQWHGVCTRSFLKVFSYVNQSMIL